MTDYTNPDVLPILPTGYRHEQPPRFEQHRGRMFISHQGFVAVVPKDTLLNDNYSHSRRWIIEPEPAIGGPDDAKAHQYAKHHNYYVVAWRRYKEDEYVIAFDGSSLPWGNIERTTKTSHQTHPRYILSPLGQPVIEPVEGETEEVISDAEMKSLLSALNADEFLERNKDRLATKPDDGSPKAPHCCFIGCTNTPEWEIDADTPENTHVCSSHLASLMPHKRCEVTPLVASPTPTLDEAIDKLTGICGIAISDNQQGWLMDDGELTVDLLRNHQTSLQTILATLESAKVRIAELEGHMATNLQIKQNLADTIAQLQSSPRFNVKQWLERLLPNDSAGHDCWFRDTTSEWLWVTKRFNRESVCYKVATGQAFVNTVGYNQMVEEKSHFHPIPRSTAIDLMCKAIEAGDVKEPSPTRSDFEVWQRSVESNLGAMASITDVLMHANAALRKHREGK